MFGETKETQNPTKSRHRKEAFFPFFFFSTPETQKNPCPFIVHFKPFTEPGLLRRRKHCISTDESLCAPPRLLVPSIGSRGAGTRRMATRLKPISADWKGKTTYEASSTGLKQVSIHQDRNGTEGGGGSIEGISLSHYLASFQREEDEDSRWRDLLCLFLLIYLVFFSQLLCSIIRRPLSCTLHSQNVASHRRFLSLSCLSTVGHCIAGITATIHISPRASCLFTD